MSEQKVTLTLTIDQVIEINNALLWGRDHLLEDAEAESMLSDSFSVEFCIATRARAQEYEELANLIVSQAAQQDNR